MRLNSFWLAGCLGLIVSLPVPAQGPGMRGPGPRLGAGQEGGIHGDPPPPASPQQRATMSTMRGGLQIGPPGRWWDDKHFAKELKLRPDQQKRMDILFEANRPNLLSRYQALQQEESKMEVLTHAETLSESALFTQIDRVSQARADLEKANTHLMLQIRKEMDADQLARLEEHR